MKQEVMTFVPWVSERSRRSRRGVCEGLGLGWSRYQRWCRLACSGADLTDGRGTSVGHIDSPLEWETAAAIKYALDHPQDGYRRLSWMMVDEDVVYLSESSVYRILSERDLLHRWARPRRSSGQAPPPATGPNQRWHTDIMHLRLGDTWYFLVSFLDAYSRYIVHWELLRHMTAEQVTLAQLAALEKYPGTKPQIVSDRGCQYTSREYKKLMRRFELVHILCRVAHPQSNGLVERWHRTTRDALEDAGGASNYHRALAVIEAWVTEYNEHRLHAGLKYIQPAEYFRGNPAARIAQRTEKLARARELRRETNRSAAETAVNLAGADHDPRPSAGSAPTSSVPLRCPFSRSRHPGVGHGRDAEVSLQEKAAGTI